MDSIIPWVRWVELIRPYYYKQFRGKRGRRPLGIEMMLRMYLLQACSPCRMKGWKMRSTTGSAIRKFMGLNFMQQKVPEATTLLHFRHLKERRALIRVNLEQFTQICSLTAISKKEWPLISGSLGL